MRQFFAGPVALDRLWVSAAHLVLKLLNAAALESVLIWAILIVFMRLAGGFFFVALAEQAGHCAGSAVVSAHAATAADQTAE